MYDGSHGGEDSGGNPSDTMVKNAINNGLSIIHYTGHGDTDVWVTSNFNTGDVNALTNNNELPFICTVGCKSGDFGGTCLGEVFTYATNNGEPTGAIATFMSTIYQGWAPPMEAQDEMVDILDIVLIVNSILGNIELDATQLNAANVNGDNIVNILDIILVINMILGLGI